MTTTGYAIPFWFQPTWRAGSTAPAGLPKDERQVFSLVRIQGLSHAEAAEVPSVSTNTVQRRIHRSMLLLAAALDDLRPQDPA